MLELDPLDNRDEYVASLPSLRLTDVRISGELVNQHERMLTGGFYAELTVSFDMAIAQESKGRPFGVESLRPIQLSRRDALDTLRNQSRISPLQNRVYFGGALSGRDTNAVNKTVSGLLKLLYPSGDEAVPEADLEWAVRIAMEVRRRVKEQQKRIGAAEFRNTHFSYIMGTDGVEKFVSTPELQSDQSIGGDPLEPGQVWTISPGDGDEHPGLYRIEVNEGPGSGVRILNKPIPPAFRESMGYAEQNLYARAVQLVGDKDPRQHEFTVQLRAFDASRSGARLGIAALVALCTALLRRSVRGGLILVGEINLGGSIEPIHNAVTLAEIAVEKGATALVMPVACRRQLLDLSDDMATRIDIQFYADAKDALLKAMAE